MSGFADWLRDQWRNTASRVEAVSAAFWNYRFTTYTLLWAPYLVGLWIYLYPRLPGIAGVVLGGIAAIMTFREMHHTHKLLFSGAILLLIFLEFRDIRIDRKASDQKAASDSAAQNKHFQSIQNSQNDNFNRTAEGLREAIAGIESTLKSVNQTEEQTRPRAVIHYANGMNIQNAPAPPAMFATGVMYQINSDLLNDGNDSGLGLRALRRVFVGKPDDRTAQSELVAQFENEWSKLPRAPEPTTSEINHKGFQTDLREFTADEGKETRNRRNSISYQEI